MLLYVYEKFDLSGFCDIPQKTLHIACVNYILPNAVDFISTWTGEI